MHLIFYKVLVDICVPSARTGKGRKLSWSSEYANWNLLVSKCTGAAVEATGSDCGQLATNRPCVSFSQLVKKELKCSHGEIQLVTLSGFLHTNQQKNGCFIFFLHLISCICLIIWFIYFYNYSLLCTPLSPEIFTIQLLSWLSFFLTCSLLSDSCLVLIGCRKSPPSAPALFLTWSLLSCLSVMSWAGTYQRYCFRWWLSVILVGVDVFSHKPLCGCSSSSFAWFTSGVPSGLILIQWLKANMFVVLFLRFQMLLKMKASWHDVPFLIFQFPPQIPSHDCICFLGAVVAQEEV